MSCLKESACGLLFPCIILFFSDVSNENGLKSMLYLNLVREKIFRVVWIKRSASEEGIFLMCPLHRSTEIRWVQGDLTRNGKYSREFVELFKLRNTRRKVGDCFLSRMDSRAADPLRVLLLLLSKQEINFLAYNSPEKNSPTKLSGFHLGHPVHLHVIPSINQAEVC